MTQSNEPTAEIGSACGARLKQARESAGLSLEDVSARLKVPVKIVRALESDDWSQLGAPVFARGQLRSYARLLRVDIESALAYTDVAAAAPAELVSHAHTPRYRRVFEQATHRAIYIVMTVAIAVPVWLASQSHLSNKPSVQSLDISELPQGTEPAAAASAQTASEPAASQRTPVIASIASVQAPAVAPAALSLAFSGESWVQIYAADGSTLEKGLLFAGDRRSYAAGEVGRVVLGNSSAVEVQQTGKPVDLASFTRANVARFTLSSDGSLAPVAN